MTQTSNRFDLLRLVFAALVFVYHAIALTGFDKDGSVERSLALAAELSIQGFFIVSGALVYGSWERSPSLSDYVGKRIRRLYPAYLTVLLIPALISFGLTLDGGGVVRYLAANSVFLNFLSPDLPGLFSNNRFSEVNGALWTLKIEVLFYIVLPVLALGLARLRQQWWIGIAILISAGFLWRDGIAAWSHPMSDQLARQLPGQMMYFAAGMAIWRLWDVLRGQALTCLAIGGVVLTLSLSIAALDALRVLGLSAVIVGIAFAPGPALNAARFGDVSYGVYIVHFPVLQALIALEVFARWGPVIGLGLSAVVVLAFSYALWWLVEKPALRRDSHYRRASGDQHG